MGFFVRRESRPPETPEEKGRRLKLRVEGFLFAGGDPRKFLDEVARTDYLSDLTPVLLHHGPEFERVSPVRFRQLLEAADVAEWYRRKRPKG